MHGEPGFASKVGSPFPPKTNWDKSLDWFLLKMRPRQEKETMIRVFVSFFLPGRIIV